MEQVAFRLAIMDSFLEWYDRYVSLLELRYRLDRSILILVTQAGQSKPGEYVTIGV